MTQFCADRGEDLRRRGTVLAGQEFLGLLQRAADVEQERHDHAADDERDAPAPGADLGRRQQRAEQVAEDGGDHDRHLLAGRLPGDVEALVAGRRHLRQVDRHAAQFDAGRESLQQAPDQHQGGGQQADRCVARHEGDQDRAARHDGQRQDQAFAAADLVDVGAQDDGAERTHQEAGAEGHEGQHQAGELAAGREERLGDVGRVEAEQEEVEHFQEIAARHAQNGGDGGGFGAGLGRR